LIFSSNRDLFKRDKVPDANHAGQIYFNENGVAPTLAMSQLKKSNSVPYNGIKQKFCVHVKPKNQFHLHRQHLGYLHLIYSKHES
jgi:hypothetical protein